MVRFAEETFPSQGASPANEAAVHTSTRGRLSVGSVAGVPTDASADTSPLRVGFVSSYFGEEVSLFGFLLLSVNDFCALSPSLFLTGRAPDVRLSSWRARAGMTLNVSFRRSTSW